MRCKPGPWQLAWLLPGFTPKTASNTTVTPLQCKQMGRRGPAQSLGSRTACAEAEGRGGRPALLLLTLPQSPLPPLYLKPPGTALHTASSVATKGVRHPAPPGTCVHDASPAPAGRQQRKRRVVQQQRRTGMQQCQGAQKRSWRQPCPSARRSVTLRAVPLQMPFQCLLISRAAARLHSLSEGPASAPGPHSPRACQPAWFSRAPPCITKRTSQRAAGPSQTCSLDS